MKKRVISYGFLAAIFCAFAVSNNIVVLAQHSHQENQMQTQPAGIQEKSFEQLMHDAMMTMDNGMKAAPMTGYPDHDFAAMMIPHHQGAVDMAKAELRYGRDPVLRRLAQEIIVTQEQEIQAMQVRLKKLNTR